MGAMLRFKQETGKDINDGNMSLTDNVKLIWCCIKSACAHDKVKFDISLMDFADNIDAKDIEPVVTALYRSIQREGNGKSEDASEGDEEGN